MKKYVEINADTISVSTYNKSGQTGEELLIEFFDAFDAIEGFEVRTFDVSLLYDDDIRHALTLANEHGVDTVGDMEHFLELCGIMPFEKEE